MIIPAPAIGMAFPGLALFLTVIIFLAVRQRAVSARQKAVQEEFWEDELKANSNIGVPFSSIEFMYLPLERLPIGRCPVEDIINIENELTELSEKPLLNLTGMTNTEVKMTYGVPNFEKLSAIGEDFDRVTVLLNDYGRLLLENEMLSEATAVLEYAVGIKTDVSQTYTSLVDCYKKHGHQDKINNLRLVVENTNLLLKPSILAYIDESLSASDKSNASENISD